MPTHNLEHKPKSTVTEIVSDICKLLKQTSANKCVVVCENPKALESATKAEWGREIDGLRAEMSKAGSGIKATLLDNDIVIMESLTFVSAPPLNLEADVLFARPDEAQLDSPKCDILIITVPLEPESINKTARNLRSDGQVIVYG